MGGTQTGQVGVDKKAILDQVLNDSRQYIRQRLGQQKQDTFGVHQNQSNQGGSMTNNTLILELEEKIRAVEERLGQIAGYKFIPPSIQQEKAELEKKKSVLAETKKRLEGGGRPVSDSPPENKTNDLFAGYEDKDIVRFAQKENPVIDKPHAVSSPADDDEGQKKQQEDETKSLADIAKSEDGSEPSDELIGESYSVTADTADGGVENINLETDKQESKADKKDQAERDNKEDKSSEEEKAGREAKPLNEIMASKGNGNANDVLRQTAKVIDLLREVLGYSNHHPDKEYLEGVLQNFESTVKSLGERVEKVKINDRLKARAVKGRVALYLEEIKSEFSFSQLLDDNIEQKVDEIIK